MGLQKRIIIFTLLNMMFLGTSLADDTLSYEQKIESIESLRAYENQVALTEPQRSRERQTSSTQDKAGSKIAAGSAKNSQADSADEAVQTNTILAFICDEKSEHTCELQEFMHNLEHQQNDPYKKSFVSNGKYEVRVFFNNDSHFPIKYLEKRSFEAVPEVGRVHQENKIFEHYLGSKYSLYNPKLNNVYHNVVGISVQVASSDELNRFLDDDRVQGIFHIGNDKGDLEEGYH